MVKLKWVFIFLISVGLLVFSFLLIQTYEKEIFSSNQLSSTDYDNDNIEIRRDKYNLRNFMWSGIFPLYGGFISDPHFLYSQPVNVSDYLSSIFHHKNVRYQLIDVNPFFENNSSENILAMEIDSTPYEYKLNMPPDFQYNTLQHVEPDSVFLYNGDSLYFVRLCDYWENKFLLYEINYPFNENKVLNYQYIDITKSEIVDSLDFSLSADQVDLLLHHNSRKFYQFYANFLNQNYASNQINFESGKGINLTTYYGSTLNIEYNKMKDIINEEYSMKVHNRYEFITFTNNVIFSNNTDVRKIVLELLHSNYYDLLLLGDSFDTSDFASRIEKKYILIEYDDINRLLSYIDEYKNLRKEESSSIVYFKKNSPFLIEVITQFNDELTIDRSVLSMLVLPPNMAPETERRYSNRTEYALPYNAKDEDYLFTMDFNDGYSIKLSYDETEKLEEFLKAVPNK